MKNKTADSETKPKPTRSSKIGGQPETDRDAQEAGASSATDTTDKKAKRTKK